MRSKLPESPKGRSDEILTATVPDRADRFFCEAAVLAGILSERLTRVTKMKFSSVLSPKMEISVSYCAEKNGNTDRGDKKPGVCQY